MLDTVAGIHPNLETSERLLDEGSRVVRMGFREVPIQEVASLIFESPLTFLIEYGLSLEGR